MHSPIQWISHRGLSHNTHENTLEAFKQSAQAGFHCLETDLHSTYDNHIVLCHDSYLGNISQCTKMIEQMTRLELEALELNNGSHLLFLDDFMAEFTAFNWVFDIKSESAKQTITLLKAILQADKSLLKKIIFLFWSQQDQTLFLKDFPDAICFSRIEECYWSGIAILLGLSMFAHIQTNKIYSIPPKFLGFPLLNKRIVQNFHRHHAKVLAYLPPNKARNQTMY